MSHRRIKNHLEGNKCEPLNEAIAKADKSKSRKRLPKQELLRLRVVDRYEKLYWLELEVNSLAKLSDLDAYLRAIWLECCGHLSTFKKVRDRRARLSHANDDGSIGSDSDDDDDDDEDESSEDAEDEFGGVAQRSTLAKAFGRHTQLRYSYDFGTPTALDIELVARRRGVPKS
jgi:hypothetical protein